MSERVTVLQRHFNELSITGYLKLNLLERQQLTEMKIYNREGEGKGEREVHMFNNQMY